MAIYRSSVNERKYVAGAGGVAPGTITEYAGKAWISAGLNAPEGSLVSAIQDAVVEIEKTSAATAYTDGEEVEFNFTTQKTVASGGTVIGLARGASAGTRPTVLVALNEHLGFPETSG